MTLTEIQEQVRKELKINDLELDIESLRIPSLHSKYLQLLTEHSLLLKKTQGEYAVLKRNKWIYYTGKASDDVYKEKGDFPLKLKTKDDEKTFIEADEEIRELVDEAEKKCRKILTDNVDELHIVAKGLLEYETLTGEEIKDLIKGVRPSRDDFDTDPDTIKPPTPTSVPKTSNKISPQPQ